MTVIHSKIDFQSMSEKDIETWVRFYHEVLIGSALFTRNNSLTSKVVSWVERLGKEKKGFIPSHTGSIVEKDGEIFIFNMCPPKAYLQPLSNYLKNTKDDYVLIMRNFPLNTQMFSANILYHVGEFYPYLSALRSVFTKRQSKWRTHCSELHLRELQKQGIFKMLNPEITPDELFIFMKNVVE